MHTFLQKLANAQTPRTDGDQLKLLGRRAAGLYTRGEVPNLTASVELIASEEGLAGEQIRRVAEVANQQAWNELFIRGGDREVEFPPANADRVIGGMAVKPNVIDGPDPKTDFTQDLPNENFPEDMDLAKLLGAPVNPTEYPDYNPLRGDEIGVEKKASAVDLARFGVDQLVTELATHGEKFYGLVKQAHLMDGVGILQIGAALRDVFESPEFGAEILQQCAARLEREGVKFDTAAELQKVATAVVVNVDHPLVQTAALLERLSFAHYSAEDTHEKLAALHQRAVSDMRSKARGSR